MKRFAVLAVLGLALTACGSSGHVIRGNGPRPLIRIAPSPTAFHFSAASNREFARHDIQKLLRIVVLPSGARQTTSVPRGAPRWLRRNWESRSGTAGAATAHRLWVVHEPEAKVQAFIRTHVPSRPRPEVPYRSNTNGIAFRGSGDYLFAAVPGRSWSRSLFLAIAPIKGGSTAVLAQATEYWNHTVPRGAELGRTVKRIDIRSGSRGKRPNVLVHVRSAYAVGSIVAWMNGLSATRGVACFGPFTPGPTVTLTFRSTNGAVVAQAVVSDPLGSGRSGPCNPLSLTIGKRSPQLAIGADLLLRIQQLLGIDLAPADPSVVSSCLRGDGWVVRTYHRPPVRIVATHRGRKWAITFPLTGKVSTNKRPAPAIARCLRTPLFTRYG